MATYCIQTVVNPRGSSAGARWRMEQGSRKRFFKEEQKLLLKKTYDLGMNSAGTGKLPQIQQLAKRNDVEIKVTYNLANSSQLRNIFLSSVYRGV